MKSYVVRLVAGQAEVFSATVDAADAWGAIALALAAARLDGARAIMALGWGRWECTGGIVAHVRKAAPGDLWKK